MKRVRGFTIIEVLLFLGVTGLLLTGMLIGTGANLSRERYNDGVRTVEEFLAQQFMLVQNPERMSDGSNDYACVARTNGGGNLAMDAINSSDLNSISHITTTNDPAILGPLGITGEFRGRSNCLIYGRFIEFYVENGDQRIRASTVVGRDLEAFAIANNDIDYRADLLDWTDEQLINATKIGRADDSIIFTPDWGVTAAGYTRSGTTGIIQNPAEGSILVMRMPISGSVRTYISTTGDARNVHTLNSFAIPGNSTDNRYFCMIPDGSGIWTPTRSIIRVQQNVGNISAVSVLPTDTAADDEGVLIQCRQ